MKIRDSSSLFYLEILRGYIPIHNSKSSIHVGFLQDESICESIQCLKSETIARTLLYHSEKLNRPSIRESIINMVSPELVQS